MAHKRRRHRRREEKRAREEAAGRPPNWRTYPGNIYSKSRPDNQTSGVNPRRESAAVSLFSRKASLPTYSQLYRYNNKIFPAEFGVYHASTFGRSYVLAESNEKSRSSPLFYVSTTHGSLGFGSQPDLVLHSDASRSSPAIATAKIRGLSRITNICLYHPSGQSLNIILQGQGPFRTSVFFSIPVGDGTTEVFDWRRNTGPDGICLSRTNEKKLIRASTGQVVAVWTPPYQRWWKLGRMSWHAEQDQRDVLGMWFELAAVVTRLIMLEIEKL